ncbi:hypothetical protein, partial [Nocardioides ultimimeridianus]
RAAGCAVALLALGGVLARHQHSPPPAPASVISAPGYAGLLTALRAGPGTEVTGLYLASDFAQVHVREDGRDQMWDYDPSEGLRLVGASRATGRDRSFDPSRFDGGRLADACAATAQEVENTPDRCVVVIGVPGRLTQPAWVEVTFGQYTDYFDPALRQVYPADG